MLVYMSIWISRQAAQQAKSAFYCVVSGKLSRS